MPPVQSPAHATPTLGPRGRVLAAAGGEATVAPSWRPEGDRFVASPAPQGLVSAALAAAAPTPADGSPAPTLGGEGQALPEALPGGEASAPSPSRWEQAVGNWRTRLPVDGPRPWPEAPPDEAALLDELPPAPPAAPAIPPVEATPALPSAQNVARVLPQAAPKPKAPVELLPAMRQQDDYSCGTTSTAMLLSAWGKPTTKDQVNVAVRQAFLPSAPDDLAAYMRSQGMRASTKANASLEDLAREVEAGRPAVVLFDPISEGSPKAKHDDVFLHYVVAQGVKRDASGQITEVSFRDPGDGRTHTVKADDFMAAWTRLRVKGVDTGISRLMISAVPEGAEHAAVVLPSNGPLAAFHPTQLGRVPMKGAADVFNGWVHGRPGSVLGGLVKALGGGLLALPFMTASSGLHALGWHKVAQGTTAVGGALVGAVGFLATGLQKGLDGAWAGVKGLFS